ncbi:MAG: hypothetical protein OXG47_08510 [bacterium]|nr:hypothetical protein [bacterium]
MVLGACSEGPNAWLSTANLTGATYLTESTDAGEVTLEAGGYRQALAPGSASAAAIRLERWSAGDLDGAGRAAAAVIIIDHPGGSDRFAHLHALLSRDGEWVDAEFAFPGDRLRIERVPVQAAAITVAMRERRSDTPSAEPRTIPVIRRFRLEWGSLVELALDD